MIWVENKIFLKDESAGEIGTTRASINRSGKTNAGKGAKDCNAYKDFHEEIEKLRTSREEISREIEAHILASFGICWDE